jgi:hypothetical protein
LQNQALSFEFRGFAKIWGEKYEANATWFWTRCVVTPAAITVRVFSREHIHLKEELVELRWTRLPFPSLVVISRHGSTNLWSGFFTVRSSRLREALAVCGHTYTSESRWPSFQRALQDVRNYGLYNEGG